MDQDESPAGIAMRARLLAEFRQECEATALERVDRYLRVQHHLIVGDTPFAPASAECIALFRDGHFYGCISLSQAVGEAIVRHMCQSNQWRPAQDFEENVRTLKQREFIDEEVEGILLGLWQSRNDYHHLNDNIATDHATLQDFAFAKIRALTKIETWVFGFSSGEGGLILRHPQYWPKKSQGKAGAFLRIDL